MTKKITLTKKTYLTIAMFLLLCNNAFAQVVYQHGFTPTSSTPIAHPYTDPPSIIDASLVGSQWTSYTSAFQGYLGSPGGSLGLANANGADAHVALTFNVASGKQLTINSLSFYHRSSFSTPPNWEVFINGVSVATGLKDNNGTNVGPLTITAAGANLTGTVTIKIAVGPSNASSGTYRIDNFTINGLVTDTCIAPVITSAFPTTGPANTIVTINGSGFQAGTGTTAVKFNGIDATAFTVVSDNIIRATVPVGASTGAISTITNGCPGSGPAFTVLESSCVSSEIYISELYDQASGTGGMIELFNPGNTPVDLSSYSLHRYQNFDDSAPASDPFYNVTLSGIIQPNSTFLFYANQPNTGICLTPTATIGYANGINAKDKQELRKNGVVIDVAQDHYDAGGYTYIRKPNAIAPKTAFNINDWNYTKHTTAVPNTFCSTLGAHTATPTPTTPPTIINPVSLIACEGGTTAFPVLAPAGYTYQWKVLNAAGNWVNVTDGGNYSGATTATLTITNIPASFNQNQYYCQMVSASCTLESNAALLTLNPRPVTPTVTTTDPSCTTATGSITITSPVGAGLTYSTDGVNFNAATTISNLAPGTYDVFVKNTEGCISIPEEVQINVAPAAPAAPTVSATQPTCTIPTGSIIVTAPTGAGIQYCIDGTCQTGNTFANLAPGTYNISVQNASGCTSAAATVTINATPAAPATPTATPTQPTCTTATGTITVDTPTGAGIQYCIDGTCQIGNIFANLAPGTYNISVQNAAGCTSAAATVTINAAPAAPATPTATPTQPTCAAATGTITVDTPTGAGLQYCIDGTCQTGNVFANLAPGTYNISVQNAAGCISATTTVTINTAPAAPAVPTVNTTAPTCTVATGTITVDAPTGAGLQYCIDGTCQTGNVFANLAPGQYDITVQNAAGCISAATTVTINTAPAAPAAPTVNTTAPTCTVATGTINVDAPTGAGLQYCIDGTCQTSNVFTNLAPGQYDITVQNAAGCISAPTTVTINTAPAAPAAPTVNTTAPTCTVATGTITVDAPTGAGLQYCIDGTCQTANVFTNLMPGQYDITVQNAAGCISAATTVTINNATDIPSVATYTVIQPTCTNPSGTITITAPLAADLVYSIDGTNFQATATFTNVQSGSYQITVKTPAGCISISNAVIINNIPALPQITSKQGCSETSQGNNYIVEALPVNNSFDAATATFLWTNSSGNTLSGNESSLNVTQYALENNITPNDFPLEFTVTVTNAEGCENSTDIIVNQYFCDVPRGISPNNDGLNDNFNLTGMNVTKLNIYNRYGREVYSKNNYTNEWYGQSNNGNELPTGTYYYVAETSGNDTKTGWVYINRQQ